MTVLSKSSSPGFGHATAWLQAPPPPCRSFQNAPPAVEINKCKTQHAKKKTERFVNLNVHDICLSHDMIEKWRWWKPCDKASKKGWKDPGRIFPSTCAIDFGITPTRPKSWKACPVFLLKQKCSWKACVLFLKKMVMYDARVLKNQLIADPAATPCVVLPHWSWAYAHWLLVWPLPWLNNGSCSKIPLCAILSTKIGNDWKRWTKNNNVL